MMYRSELTSPLAERNWDQPDLRRDGSRRPAEVSENDLMLKMQRKMTGLDSKQRKVINEYEQELDTMKNEIKKIKVSYDHLKQKNTRYRHHLKEKTEQVKKLQDEQTRMARTQTSTTWSSEKTKLLAKLKQLDVEKKQVEEQYRSLLSVKDENVKLKSEVESLRFKETIWKKEKEKMEKKRSQMREHTKEGHQQVDKSPKDNLMSSNLKFGLSSGEFNFDDVWNRITNSTHLSPTDKPYASLPSTTVSARNRNETGKEGRNSAKHTLRRTASDFQESTDLQDIRKSLHEAREELIQAKGEAQQAKKDQLLQELKERDELQRVQGMATKGEADAQEVRHMICTMEAKIASLETNCLSEVQNLVSNVDILKHELLNTQQELQYLKEYSKTAETQRAQEKIQLMNESRELKLDLSSLRTEIRDKSEASDRTDASKSVFSDSREQEESFEKHYSPLVGFVGSRCDYLKMKLETLKKHLKNLDLQTKTVLNHSLTSSDDGRQPSDHQTQPQPQGGGEKTRKTPKSKAPETAEATPTSIKRMKKSGDRSNGSGRSDGSGRLNDNKVELDKMSKERLKARKTSTPHNNDDDRGDTGSDDTDDKMDVIDDDEIVVLTPRPHRNRFDQDMDLLIVENGENIERLRLPSLEEEDEEDDEDDDDDDNDDDDDEDGDETMENSDTDNVNDGDDTMSTGRGEVGTPRDRGVDSNRRRLHGSPRKMGSPRNMRSPRIMVSPRTIVSPRTLGSPRIMESPRLSDRSSARMDDDEIISKYLVNEDSRTSCLANQVDSRFEKLERELARHERRRTSKGPPPLQADHRILTRSTKQK